MPFVSVTTLPPASQAELNLLDIVFRPHYHYEYAHGYTLEFRRVSRMLAMYAPVSLTRSFPPEHCCTIKELNPVH